MYIRFVVGSAKEKANTLHGPITELRLLRDEGALYDYEEIQANDVFEWFNAQLPCPPFDSSNWPITAISWFKVSQKAQIFVQKMYEIQFILNEHGIQTRTLKTGDPGMKLYEDEYQIVATSPRGKY
jgi:hypothetical protein